jgi:hypothetical protein
MRHVNALGLLRPAVALVAMAAGFVLLMLLARRSLRGRGPMALDGIVGLDDAVAACQHSYCTQYNLALKCGYR